MHAPARRNRGRWAGSGWLGLWCLLLAGAALPTGAQDPRALVLHGKAATALVDLPLADGSGTAFCVSTAGYFVTNDHVVEDSQGQITLLIHPGEPDQQSFSARVIRTDKDLDLALLKIDGAAGLTALPLGRDDDLMETDPVTAFGYPFGTVLALSDTSYPNVSVSLGHITALRRDKDGLQYIQLDASLNPGNSGGPVLDAQGRVIGVVQGGVPGAAINLAIPVHFLADYLRKPTVVLTAPPIAREEITQPHVFRIDVDPVFPDPGPLDVQLSFSIPLHKTWRVFTAHQAGPSTYLVSAAPVAPSVHVRELWLTALSTDGVAKPGIMATLQDRPVMVRGQVMALSQLKTVTFAQGKSQTVQLATGEVVPGPVTGLSAVPVVVNGVSQTVDLTQYGQVSLVDPNVPPPSIQYAVRVRRDGKGYGTDGGTLSLTGYRGANGSLIRAAHHRPPRANGTQGMLIVCADCWPTSDTGFAQAPAGAAEAFVQNVAHAFAGPDAGFLIYSTHWAFGGPFQKALRDAGDRVTVSMHPEALDDYDGVFVGGNADVNREALADYLAQGGRVYVAAATGDIPDELGFWNVFLAPYGLQVRPGPHIADRQVETGFPLDPLFFRVGGLLVRGPCDIAPAPGDWPDTRVFHAKDGVGYVAQAEVLKP